LELGTEPGKIRVEAIRISRVLRWATWRGAALDQWKPKAGIERVVAKDGALELELSGVEPARLAHIAVAPSLKAGARREQTMAAIAGALLGVSRGALVDGQLWPRRDRYWAALVLSGVVTATTFFALRYARQALVLCVYGFALLIAYSWIGPHPVQTWHLYVTEMTFTLLFVLGSAGWLIIYVPKGPPPSTDLTCDGSEVR
jgi:hypothetical protein